ncbi:MAG: hypothetical protein ACP5H2_05860 [Solirubrobacteraceae bacterium]
MALIHGLEAEAQAAGQRRELLWLLEELRVTQLAPGPLVRPGATIRRVRDALVARRLSAASS